MNIKLHTPKSLKAGSGMSSMKQFLLSLLATTVSIALTFGTAAIVDNNKKQKEKREIVMMVMYDLHNSLKSVEKADSNLHQIMDWQLQIAEDTTLFESLKYSIMTNLPKLDYTETVERIFSSNIESINTVGNVLFTEMVSEFYSLRKKYKESVCDSIFNEIKTSYDANSFKSVLDFGVIYYNLLSGSFLSHMQQKYANCKKMMSVTDEQLDVYIKKRELLEKDKSAEQQVQDSLLERMGEINEKLEEAKKNLKLE